MLQFLTWSLLGSLLEPPGWPGGQNDSQMTPRWLPNDPQMAPRWLPDGSQMTPRCFPDRYSERDSERDTERETQIEILREIQRETQRQNQRETQRETQIEALNWFTRKLCLGSRAGVISVVLKCNAYM